MRTQRIVEILACWGSIDASLKNLVILKNKGREKGANFRVFSTLEHCLSAFCDMASLKGRQVEPFPHIGKQPVRANTPESSQNAPGKQADTPTTAPRDRAS